MTLFLAVALAFAPSWLPQETQPVRRPAAEPARRDAAADPFRPAPGQWNHPEGILGTVYPEARDVLLDDTLVNQDEEGGATQTLAALAAHPDGFVATWYDSRHGNIGLFLGRVGRNGERVGSEEPVHAPRTARQLEPAVAAGPGIGAVAWFASEEGEMASSVRFLAPESGMIGVRHSLALPEGGGAPPPRGGAAGSPAPAVAFDEAGGGLAAWLSGGRVRLRRLNRNFAVGGGPFVLDEEGPAALGDIRLAHGSGRFAGVWSRADGVAFWTAGGAGATRVAAGRVGGFASAGDAGGWWLLAREEAGLRLHRLDADGRPEGAALPPLPARITSVSLAVMPIGPVLAIERDGGVLELVVFEAAAGRWLAPLPLVGPESRGASGPRIAAHGSRALVAWTDRRHGDPDVFYRLLGPTGFEGPERRWNTDAGSADQMGPVVASDGEERAVIVWEDRRFAQGVLFARRLESRRLHDKEFAVGDRRAEGESGAPMVAMASDGGFAVVWKQRERGQARVLARTYDAEDRARGATIELGGYAHPAWRAGVVALEDGAYGVLFDAAPAAGAVPRLHFARISARGTLDGRPIVVEGKGHAPRSPHLSVLADRRMLAVWDEAIPNAPPAHFGRFLARDGTPSGERIAFPPSEHRIGDIDPVAAPTPDGGFYLAWTGNDGPVRDVYAQRFDREGRPAGRPIPVSVRFNEQDFPEILALPDGSFVVLWEDDISYFDHIQACRLSLDGVLGPAVTVNQRPSIFVEDRTGPHAAVLAGGFVAVWSDRRRGLGHDVYVRVVGPAFDQDLEPVTFITPGG